MAIKLNITSGCFPDGKELGIILDSRGSFDVAASQCASFFGEQIGTLPVIKTLEDHTRLRLFKDDNAGLVWTGLSMNNEGNVTLSKDPLNFSFQDGTSFQPGGFGSNANEFPWTPESFGGIEFGRNCVFMRPDGTFRVFDCSITLALLCELDCEPEINGLPTVAPTQFPTVSPTDPTATPTQGPTRLASELPISECLGNKQYALLRERLSFERARNQCQRLFDGDLAMPKSREELDFIKIFGIFDSTDRTNDRVLGLRLLINTDPEDPQNWVYADGTRIQEGDFLSDPSNLPRRIRGDCAITEFNGMKTELCSGIEDAICEFECGLEPNIVNFMTETKSQCFAGKQYTRIETEADFGSTNNFDVSKRLCGFFPNTTLPMPKTSEEFENFKSFMNLVSWIGLSFDNNNSDTDEIANPLNYQYDDGSFIQPGDFASVRGRAPWNLKFIENNPVGRKCVGQQAFDDTWLPTGCSSSERTFCETTCVPEPTPSPTAAEVIPVDAENNSLLLSISVVVPIVVILLIVAVLVGLKNWKQPKNQENKDVVEAKPAIEGPLSESI